MPAGSIHLLTAATLPAGLLAYVGIGPGQELIPYFLTLLGFMGLALLAVVQWPVLALLRVLARLRNREAVDDAGAPAADPDPEAPGAEAARRA